MKALPTSIALLMAVSATAQRQWLLDTGSVWSIVECTMGACSTREWKLVGDTVVAGTTYQKLQYRWVPGSGPWYYWAALREDGQGRVYGMHLWEPGEVLLYDFTLDVGDVFTGRSLEGCPIQYTVSAIDSVTMRNGEKRRRTMFLEAPWRGEWVEGIGSMHGLPNAGSIECLFDASWGLLCWHRNDTLLYPNDGVPTCNYNTISIREDDPPRVLRMFPNPARERVTLTAAEPLAEVRVMDALGRLVLTQRTNGAWVELDVGGLVPGSYFVHARGKEQVYRGRVVVE